MQVVGGSNPLAPTIDKYTNENWIMIVLFRISFFFFGALFFCFSHAAIVEEQIHLPVVVKNIYGAEFRHTILVTVFRDESRSNSPWLILNHGRPTASEIPMMGRQRYSSNSKYFVEKGFVVFVPTRVGYGPTGGPDVEYSGECGRNNFPVVYQAAADQVSTLIDKIKTFSYVNPKKGLIVGQSYGGMTSIALSTFDIDGLLGVVNFSGGGGGNPVTRPENPCGENLLRRAYFDYGQNTKNSSLWLYSTNDKFWGEAYPKLWFDEFKQGADKNKIFTKFVALPPFKENGHSIFVGNRKAWQLEFEQFLEQIGF